MTTTGFVEGNSTKIICDAFFSVQNDLDVPQYSSAYNDLNTAITSICEVCGYLDQDQYNDIQNSILNYQSIIRDSVNSTNPVNNYYATPLNSLTLLENTLLSQYNLQNAGNNQLTTVNQTFSAAINENNALIGGNANTFSSTLIGFPNNASDSIANALNYLMVQQQQSALLISQLSNNVTILNDEVNLAKTELFYIKQLAGAFNISATNNGTNIYRCNNFSPDYNDPVAYISSNPVLLTQAATNCSNWASGSQDLSLFINGKCSDFMDSGRAISTCIGQLTFTINF